MAKGRRKLVWLFGFLLLGLSGCFFRATEDLYRSPERSADYLNLTNQIQQIRHALSQKYGSDAEGISVVTGDHTALIQLQDLDGDGERETAVTFFRVPEAEKPLKIFFFTKTSEDYYTVTAMVEGNGSSIYRVDYGDLDGQGYQELIVSWQIGTGTYLLGVYSLDEPINYRIGQAKGQRDREEGEAPSREELRAAEWLMTAYSEYSLTDLDQDGQLEVAIARVDPTGVNSSVELYGWHNGAFMFRGAAPLSAGIASIKKNGMKENFLYGDAPLRALYISSDLFIGRRAVDILAYQGSYLTNISLNPETNLSYEVLDRSMDLGPVDVNQDGIWELPSPVPLPEGGDSTASDLWLLDWSQYDNWGTKTWVCSTYHNVADGWYLELPAEWRRWVIPSRYDGISGQRAVIFSYFEEDSSEPTPFMVIYKFTSQMERANMAKRFPLWVEDEAVYAATLYEGASEVLGVTEAQLRDSFHLIQSSWSDE